MLFLFLELKDCRYYC